MGMCLTRPVCCTVPAHGRCLSASQEAGEYFSRAILSRQWDAPTCPLRPARMRVVEWSAALLGIVGNPLIPGSLSLLHFSLLADTLWRRFLLVDIFKS